MQQVAGLMKTLAQQVKLLWLDNLTLVPFKKKKKKKKKHIGFFGEHWKNNWINY